MRDGNGNWKHFSVPPNVCWPVGGEIDVMEMYGCTDGSPVFGTEHYGVQCGEDEWDGCVSVID